MEGGEAMTAPIRRDHRHDSNDVGCALLFVFALLIYIMLVADKKVKDLEARIVAIEVREDAR